MGDRPHDLLGYVEPGEASWHPPNLSAFVANLTTRVNVAEPSFRVELSDSLRKDEADLRVARPQVRVSVLGHRGISIGAGQLELPIVRSSTRAGFPSVIRRSTGGTSVLHLEGDILWSLVLPRVFPMVGRDFVTAYPRLGSGVAAFLRGNGLDARWNAPPGIKDDFCLLGSRGYVLTVGGKILGGAAQHLTARALLHHGCLQYSLEPGLVTELFDLPFKTVQDHLTSLTALRVTETPEDLGRGLNHSLRVALGEQGIAVSGSD